jgi:NADP-dependent 3-hydroxy acid dehydrogenase YdfG
VSVVDVWLMYNARELTEAGRAVFLQYRSRDQLKRMQSEISPDLAHDLMADASDALADQHDVNSILAEVRSVSLAFTDN